MPQIVKPLLNPRKVPVQERSTASVQAILDATIQVLTRVGRARLTTVNVAVRAGVSVGTLYQYFPNKSALLQAALKRHMDDVALTVERTCTQQQGNTPEQMAAAVVTAFFEAKMRDPKASVALYSISSDLDTASILLETHSRINTAMLEMLRTTAEPIHADLQLISDVLQGVVAGISRRFVEQPVSEQQQECMRHEVIRMISAYLRCCCVKP